MNIELLLGGCGAIGSTSEGIMGGARKLGRQPGYMAWLDPAVE